MPNYCKPFLKCFFTVVFGCIVEWVLASLLVMVFYPRFFGSFFVYPYWQPYILLHVGGAVFEVCTFVLSFELIIILVMFCNSSPLPHAVGLAC